jgi:hypothetical protein
MKLGETLFFKYLPIAIFIVILGFLMVGGSRMVKEQNALKEDCTKTDLYVIGNKGHLTGVYACGGK